VVGVWCVGVRAVVRQEGRTRRPDGAGSAGQGGGEATAVLVPMVGAGGAFFS